MDKPARCPPNQSVRPANRTRIPRFAQRARRAPPGHASRVMPRPGANYSPAMSLRDRASALWFVLWYSGSQMLAGKDDPGTTGRIPLLPRSILRTDRRACTFEPNAPSRSPPPASEYSISLDSPAERDKQGAAGVSPARMLIARNRNTAWVRRSLLLPARCRQQPWRTRGEVI